MVLNRDSGMERPHDWISNDPDFAPLLRHDSPYTKVRAFLEAQERRDYPMKQTTEERPTGRGTNRNRPGRPRAATGSLRNCNPTAALSAEPETVSRERPELKAPTASAALIPLAAGRTPRG